MEPVGMFGMMGEGDSQIESGTVGWEGSDTHYSSGVGTEDGHTLVRVQLYRGRDVTKPLNPEVGQGHKILCHISGQLSRIPAPGTRVFVAIPKGQDNVPGAGVIFATIDPAPQAASEASRVVYGADGTVTLLSTMDNTPSGKIVGLSVGPKGFKFFSPYGSIILDETGFHLKTKAGPRIDMGGLAVPAVPGFDDVINAISAYVKITAPTIRVNGGQVYLGNSQNGKWVGTVTAPASNITPTLPPTPVPIMDKPSTQSTPGISSRVWISV